MESKSTSRLSIADSYDGKNVLITGCTGFIGKVILEKLLRDYPGISKVFLLIRPNRDQEPYDRLQLLLESPVYFETRRPSEQTMKYKLYGGMYSMMTLQPPVQRSIIGESYDGKNVLITGATGFIGKALLEKLLRACPGISKVFLLIRPNNKQDPYNRLRRLLQSPLFDSLRDANPGIFEKVFPIESDLSSPNLGINENELADLIQSVNIVFHCAATVNLDAHLKISVDINILGTQRLIELCKQMLHLEAVVHLSTAYCNCDHSIVKEEIYPPTIPVDLLVSMTEDLDASTVEAITPQLLGRKINTYTLTKSLTESWLGANCANLPLTIVRPSITLSNFDGPLPGWLDNINGPTGVIIAGAKGMVRTSASHPGKVADLIPVDMVANLTIVAAWKVTQSTSTADIRVYNLCTGSQNPITWGKYFQLCMKHSRTYIACSHIWNANIKLSPSDLYYKIYKALFQTFPGYMVDFYTSFTGGTPKMIKTQQKVSNVQNRVLKLTRNEWTFEDDNVRNLYLSLSEEDKARFPFDVAKINWDTYFENYILGISKYILKENIKNKL